MIVTLTANPSVDRTVELAAPLERGEVQRAVRSGTDPGGKGVNVSRSVAAAGELTVAVLPVPQDDPLVLALREQQVPHRAVPVPAPCRVNLTVVGPGGVTTKINEHAEGRLRRPGRAGRTWSSSSPRRPAGTPTT